METKITSKNLNFVNLVGEKELAAYQTYIELTSYENLAYKAEDAQVTQNDYGVRDFTFPMDFCFKDK